MQFLAKRTVFHTLSVSGRIHGYIKNLSSKLNGPDGKIPLRLRHLLHIFWTVNTPKSCRVMIELCVQMLNL